MQIWWPLVGYAPVRVACRECLLPGLRPDAGLPPEPQSFWGFRIALGSPKCLRRACLSTGQRGLLKMKLECLQSHAFPDP